MTDNLRRSPLYPLEVELGGRFESFAGWELPLSYGYGEIAEHHQTRVAASLFDVSHMGLIEVHGDDMSVIATELERLMPADLIDLPVDKLRYTFLTNEAGGTIDDLMVGNRGDHFVLIVNASRYEADLAHLRNQLPPSLELVERNDMALLALQGPAAESSLAPLIGPEVRLSELLFMELVETTVAGISCIVSRSGYTGEDGFEIWAPAPRSVYLARRILLQDTVEPAGLAARGSLRIEAGLCLYGNELTESISPIEAGLTWAIPPRRRQGGGFLGDGVILDQLANGAPRQRIGLMVQGRKMVRDGAKLTSPDGEEVGYVTSGGYGATVGGPIAMALVAQTYADGSPITRGDTLVADVRGKPVQVQIVRLPFLPNKQKRR
ncbi:MAG: glycine cleavage system aminomethyltransferase GcvT [Acidimicrobiia bacterium]